MRTFAAAATLCSPTGRGRIGGMLRDTLTKLLNLPASERVDLAMALWDSLTPAEQEAEFDLTPEQRAELDRRIAEHIADPPQPFPGTRCAGDSTHHLYWPDLDVDLAVESIEHSERFPLVSKGQRAPQ